MEYQDVTAQLREAYDRSADDRNASSLAAWKLEERQRILTIFQAAGVARLLEIGAGTGKDGLFFQDHGLAVVCTDLSPEMVRHCREKGLTAYVMDFLGLDFPPASFDAVYAMNCLLHVPKRDLPAVLQHIHSLLIPDGLFYIGLYGGADVEGVVPDDWHEPKRFFARYTDEQITQVVDPFFEVVEFRQIKVDHNETFHFQSLLLQR